MKRRALWLALPLLLLSVMLGVKWRLDHPTPTPEALKVRAVLMRSSQVGIYLAEALPWENKGVYARLSAPEKKAFTESFCLLPQTMDINSTLFPAGSGRATIGIDYTMPIHLPLTSRALTSHPLTYVNVYATLDMDGSKGEIFLDTASLDGDRKYQIHPATVRRWIQILLANSHIGPALRARGIS